MSEIETVKAGDIWEDKNGDEWAVLTNRNYHNRNDLKIHPTTNLDNLVHYTITPGQVESCSLKSWFEKFEPHLVRRRPHG
jgi:hypothetical protein